MERREEDEGEEEDRDGGRAGGKLTRRTCRRRAPPTPYDRPALAGKTERRKGEGWVSKILVRPASAILPSLFSFSATSSKQDHPPPSESVPETRQEDFDRVSSADPQNQILQAKTPGVFAEQSQPYADPEVHQVLGDKARNVCDSGGIAEVEQWLKQKTFSREQSNSLVELLWSRTRDICHDDQHAAECVTEGQGTLNLKAPRKSAQCAVLSERWITPKPLESFQTIVAHDAGSSPVEIAKAYMEALATEPYHESRDGKLKLEKKSFDNGVSASEMTYSSVLKSPVCWPGAYAESNHSYLTPQTWRVKVEPYNFQRTPYHGSIFSRSKFQGGGESQRTQNVPLSRWKRPSTSGGIMVPDKHNGSTPSKEFDTSNLVSFGSMSSATLNAVKKSSSTLRVTFEKDSLAASSNPHTAEDSGYNVGPSSVHPKSSQMAQKILEHLDRNVPSPKEKMAQLKLEKKEIKTFPKSGSFAMDWHEQRSNVSVTDDDKTKDSLGKDIADKDNLATEKAARPVMSKYHDDLLPSITSKSSNRSMLGATEKTADEGFTFSFPVPTSLNVSSEAPPTPTMTSSAAVCRMLSNTEDNTPSFSFGTPRDDSGLVFSFGSISSSTLTDTTAPQFKFGSEKQCSLSFRSTSKDNICY